MIHMGDENVQGESWYPRLQNGEPSVDWSLIGKDLAHRGVHDCIKALNKLYSNSPQLWEMRGQDFTMISEYGPNCVVAYHRGTKNHKRLAVIHNFLNKGYSSYDLQLPVGCDGMIKRIQKVEEIFNSDHPNYGGSGNFKNHEIVIIRDPNSNEPTHLRIALPPLSTLVLEEQLS